MQMDGLLCGSTPVMRDWLECALADACVESQTGGLGLSRAPQTA